MGKLVLTLVLTDMELRLLRGALSERLIECVVDELEPEATSLRNIREQFKNVIEVNS